MRSFAVPDDVAAEKILVDENDGVLCAHLPKTQTAPAKVTEVPIK